MNAALLYATFFNLLYLSRAFPQYPNDGFLFDPDFDFHDFVLPSKTTAKTPIRAGKPRAPIIANIHQQNAVTPVPILKQINRHNENGSYTYGFESADGSFKIETKLATGEVIGKYGYVDDRGKLRVVEYGANKYGFQPAGEGITIPPITIGAESTFNETDDAPLPPPLPNKPAEVIRILSKPPNPKRKSQQKPIPLPAPVPQYSVLEPEESSSRPIVTPADINALQFIFSGSHEQQQQQQQQQIQQQLQAQRKLSPLQQQQQRFEEHLARENDRPPFVASFPIFDVIPLPSSDLPRSRAHHVPFDVPSRTTTATGKSAATKNRAARPKLVLVTPASGAAVEEVPPNPVRRSSNGVRVGFHEGRSILDELMKQYAIPNRSPAISDFSFSYNNY